MLLGGLANPRGVPVYPAGTATTTITLVGHTRGVAVGGGVVQQLLKENVAVQAGILVPSAVAM
jgi:hypothetical protein